MSGEPAVLGMVVRRLVGRDGGYQIANRSSVSLDRAMFTNTRVLYWLPR